jgi:DNA-binding transcriptional LysR family regulator
VLVECKPFVHDLETMAISTDMLAAFVQVATTLSVSAAAAELGVGKSVVSKRIALLEAALKATLFSRSTRKVALTPAGEAYLDHARQALAAVASGEERLRDQRLELAGQIRITAPVSWGQRVLAPVLPAFLLQHPAIEIELLLADRLMDIANERIDIAMRWTPQPAPDLVAVALAEIAWAVVASPAYLAAAGTPREPAALAGHPCMSYWRDNSDDSWSLLDRVDGGRCHNVRVRGRYHVNNAEAVVDAAAAGLGIAMLPLYVCEAALADGRLVPVLPGWAPQTRFGGRVSAVLTPERLRLSRNAALLAYLRQRLGAVG